jgi:hypothetical protein
LGGVARPGSITARALRQSVAPEQEQPHEIPYLGRDD